MAKIYQRVLAGAYAEGAYDNHVLPFLWMRGEDHATVTEYLENIAAADIHEVCLESRPHPDFCGEGWWCDLEFVLSECKRLGLKVWILDDKHFPTGYACGALEGEGVGRELKKCVLTHRTLDVVGPTPGMSVALANPFDGTEEFFGAVAARGGELLEVSFRRCGDTLVFDAPEGLTRVTLVFTSVKTGYRDEYINMVDADSCRALIDAVYEPHYQHFADEFGKTILGFFSDEPGFMNEKGATADGAIAADSLIGKSSMALPWSRELERRLRERLGCGAARGGACGTACGERSEGACNEAGNATASGNTAFLAELARLWSRDERGAFARHAYMDVATELYRECFNEQLGNWCREHGVSYIGHVIEDKDYHARLGQGAGHYFRAVGGQDMAGVDVVINQLLPGMDEGLHSYGRGAWDMEFFTYALAKLGSSAAHLDPKKQGRCMAEVFGAFGWHEGLKEMKWICDHFLVRGVNWFVPHAFSMAGFPDVDCPPHFFAHGNNPQFRHFDVLMGYLNRMGTLLSGGYAHTTAAVLYHADAEWTGDALPVQRVASQLTRAQIDFDFVPADAFSDGARYEVKLAGEFAYGEPVGEGCDRSKAGEELSCSGRTATGFSINGQRYRCLVIPGCEYLGEKTLAFVHRAVCEGIPVFVAGELPTKLYDGAEAAQEGRSSIDLSQLGGVMCVEPAELVDALREHGLYELKTSEPQRWLRCYRYSRGGEEYLFCVNEHPKQGISTRLEDATGEPVRGVRMDPLSGGNPVLFDGLLELAPYESCLIVLGESCEGASRAGAASVVLDESREGAPCDGADATVLAGPWSLSFSAPLEYPAFGEARTAESLDELREDAAYYDRCGTFRYETTFELAEPCAPVLTLADAYETVEVFVDGEPSAARVAPPYRLPLGSLLAGEHALAIEVTNTLDKDIHDMFSLTEPSEPSGLFGPVTLTF